MMNDYERKLKGRDLDTLWGLQEYILLIRWWWHWWEQYIRSYFLNRGCPKKCSILNCNVFKSITQISTGDTTLQAHHTTHNSTPYEHAHTMLYWPRLEWNCTKVTFNQSQPTHKQKRGVNSPMVPCCSLLGSTDCYWSSNICRLRLFSWHIWYKSNSSVLTINLYFHVSPQSDDLYKCSKVIADVCLTSSNLSLPKREPRYWVWASFC